MNVFLVWKNKEIISDDGDLVEVNVLIEIYSDLDMAWRVHKELNEKAGWDVSYSVEVKDVIK